MRPVITRGQWRATFKRKREVKMLSAEGPIEVCSLNPGTVFAFRPLRFLSVCMCVFGSGGLLLESLLFGVIYILPLSPHAFPSQGSKQIVVRIPTFVFFTSLRHKKHSNFYLCKT